jgi:hypothetical protein
MTSKTTTAACLFAVTFLLSACSSGTMSATPNLQSNPMTMAAQPQDRQGCSNNGDLRVSPCRVTFDSGNPGPTDVTVRHRSPDDGNRNRIKERDNCAARNIATIVRDSEHRYTVTAGTVDGSCTAEFDDNGNGNDDHGGKGQGGGSELRIVNKL